MGKSVLPAASAQLSAPTGARRRRPDGIPESADTSDPNAPQTVALMAGGKKIIKFLLTDNKTADLMVAQPVPADFAVRIGTVFPGKEALRQVLLADPTVIR